MRFNSIKDVKEFLAQIPKFADSPANVLEYNLNNIIQFSAELDNPQQHYPTIHVAGTNGKGSTCRLLASMLQSAGYRVGLYTSPHLVSYNDRFCINSQPAGNQDLLLFFNEYGKRITGLRLSYFEISTAFSFWYFYQKKVDIAVIETGLGGRLDATNIIQPELSIITSVGRDHESILGKGIEKIAREKAGIIKKDIPVLVGKLPSKAEEVIMQRAKKLNSSIYYPYGYQIEENHHLTIYTESNQVSLPFPFLAPVQAQNVAIAHRAIRILGEVSNITISPDALCNALERFNSRFPHTGCFQKLSSQLDWYYDGAHNLDALQNMTNAMHNIAPKDNFIVVLVLMKDKINKRLLNQFSGFKKIYYYELLSDRSAPYQQVVEVLPQTEELPSRDTRIKNEIIGHLKSQLVLFAGSFYFYNTVRRWVKKVTH